MDCQGVAEQTSQNKKKQDDKVLVNSDYASRGGNFRQSKKKAKDKRVEGSDIKKLPVPTQQQLRSLTDLLNSLYIKYGLTKQDIQDRRKILKHFSQSVDKELTDCSFRLVGSSISSLGFKTSDINIDLYEAEETEIPKLFIKLLNFLKNSDNYSDVKEDFLSKIPVINFIHLTSGLSCRVSTGNHAAFLTSNLLNIYGELDNRVKPLCVAFKLWAKICEVDRPSCGSFPPYSFSLMVVHYLQQTNPPVLPAVHELLQEVKITEYLEKGLPTQEIIEKIREKWNPRNSESLGSLWLGMLRYYVNQDYIQQIIVNVRQRAKCLRSSRKWGKKRFAIEDPFSTKRNVVRTLSKSNTYRYVVEHLKIALVYFGNFPHSESTGAPRVQTVNQASHDECKQNGPENIDKADTIDENQVEAEKTSPSSEYDNDSDVGNDDCDDDDDEEEEDNCGDDDDNEADDQIVDYDHDDCNSDDRHNDGDLIDGVFSVDNINDSPVGHFEQSAPSSRMITEMIIDEQVDVDSFLYSFDDSVLRKGPPLWHKCSLCDEDGHVAENCNAEEKIRLRKLPELPPWLKEILDFVCLRCAADLAISTEKMKRRREYMVSLERYIQRQAPGARLYLFGSSCNGFGFKDSDLDICMMFEGRTRSDIDCIAVITSLARLLKTNPDCNEVIAITGAKVPIVKFYFKPPNLEADISLYNEVALYNTRLLATYVEIDKRVQILGYTLKIFAKSCDIGDASRGSLSSYAYILMLLHFLQQRQPPVIPVLQEIYNSNEKPVDMVDGCNCWFFSDLKTLAWASRNSESCGELWLGFLRYFTEDFDFHRNVVCVRSRTPLTKFEKMWNGKNICIEDPFVLSHNLGAGLSDPMAKFIISTLQKAREHFGTPRARIPEDPGTRQRFFFDASILNGGYFPPTGRNCNNCGKIGHWARECPYHKRSNRSGGKGQRRDQKGKETKESNRVVESVVDGLKPDNHVKSEPIQNRKRDRGDPTQNPTQNPAQRIEPPFTRSHQISPQLNHPTPGLRGGPVDQNVTPLPVHRNAPLHISGPLVMANSPPSNQTIPGPPLNANPDYYGIRHLNPNITSSVNSNAPSPSTMVNSPLLSQRTGVPAAPISPRYPAFRRTTRPLAPFAQIVSPPGFRMPQNPPHFHASHVNVQSPRPSNGIPPRFIMNSPPFNQPFGSPPRTQVRVPTQPPLQRPRYAQITPVSPWAIGGFSNSPPRPILTCEALERGRIGENHVDGLHTGSTQPGLREENNGFSPSVLKSLQAMNIVDDVNAVTPRDGLSGNTDVVESGGARRMDEGLFSNPPNVRNVADKSLLQNFNDFASTMTTNKPNIAGMPEGMPPQLNQEKIEPVAAAVNKGLAQTGVSAANPSDPTFPLDEEVSPKMTGRNFRRRRRGRGRKNKQENKQERQESGQTVVGKLPFEPNEIQGKKDKNIVETPFVPNNLNEEKHCNAAERERKEERKQVTEHVEKTPGTAKIPEMRSKGPAQGTDNMPHNPLKKSDKVRIVVDKKDDNVEPDKMQNTKDKSSENNLSSQGCEKQTESVENEKAREDPGGKNPLYQEKQAKEESKQQTEQVDRKVTTATTGNMRGKSNRSAGAAKDLKMQCDFQKPVIDDIPNNATKVSDVRNVDGVKPDNHQSKKRTYRRPRNRNQREYGHNPSPGNNKAGMNPPRKEKDGRMAEKEVSFQFNSEQYSTTNAKNRKGVDQQSGRPTSVMKPQDSNQTIVVNVNDQCFRTVSAQKADDYTNNAGRRSKARKSRKKNKSSKEMANSGPEENNSWGK